MNEEQEMALEDLSNGHAIITIKGAEHICAFLGQTLDPKIALSWQSAEEAAEKYGIFPIPVPGGGVGLLELGYSLCYALSIDPPGRNFSGKGFQAKANAQALRDYFTQKNDVNFDTKFSEE